ncbi:hypothetical protein CBR_g37551 [Chara braunii]|uniref:Uncharacterized protein n=1 Tax=Chara braunii TaxID=69332 RepID=A0A388LN30_CHABU|nr:hypothetical protein CBR_g37551 [Chara braunii]|eukprot:GBG83750.1 hypothetical protein CBR_g37551 [Chara braunii]
MIEEWRKNNAEAERAWSTIKGSGKKTKKKKTTIRRKRSAKNRKDERGKKRKETSSEETDTESLSEDETTDTTTSDSDDSARVARHNSTGRKPTKKYKRKAWRLKGKGKTHTEVTMPRKCDKGESSRQRKEGCKGGLEHEEQDGDRETEPVTPLMGGHKGLTAGCSQKGLIEYCISAHKIYSAKKADVLKKLCEKKGIKYTKKPEAVELLARYQMKLAYDSFEEERCMENKRAGDKTKASGSPRKEFTKTTKKPATKQVPVIIRSAPVQPAKDSE